MVVLTGEPLKARGFVQEKFHFYCVQTQRWQALIAAGGAGSDLRMTGEALVDESRVFAIDSQDTCITS